MKIEHSRHFPFKRVLVYVIVLILVLVAGYSLWLGFGPRSVNEDKQSDVSSQRVDTAATPAPKTIKFAAMGDMLAHDSVVMQARTSNGYDFTKYFDKIKPLYAGSDVVFCNPETLSSGPSFGISGYPSFNAPTEFARDLRAVGCEVINLASNHVGDKGQAALNATLDVWKKLEPLAMTGANRNVDEQNTVSYFTKNGIKVAFVAFADFSNSAVTSYGLNIYHDKDLVTRLLTEARKNADLVLVSAHWGVEDALEISNDQATAAKLFSDLGADIIIGTGPHVLQKVSKIKRADGGETLVWYSIGNMLSTQLKTNELTGGVAGWTVERSADGKISFRDLTFKATFMSYEWTPTDKAAGKLTKRNTLKLQPLQDAANETKLFDSTLSDRTAFVHRAIGDEVKVTITP